MLPDEVVSLGFRTDLALLRLGGSSVEDGGDCLVVRSPHNPDHWWGNFLLLRDPPGAAEVRDWLDRFAAAFPRARHRTFGVDGRGGSVDDLRPFADAGLRTEAATVMTATSVHPPPRPNRGAAYRRLASDDDWRQSVELRVLTDLADGHGYDPVEHERFVRAKAETNRELVDAGHGGWFGAFVDGRLVAQLGLYAAGPGLARFQAVETHPGYRGRGLAGTLVHVAGRWGLDELGARTLVMVADPDYVAIRVYRSVGFADTERQLQAERPSG